MNESVGTLDIYWLLFWIIPLLIMIVLSGCATKEPVYPDVHPSVIRWSAKEEYRLHVERVMREHMKEHHGDN